MTDARDVYRRKSRKSLRFAVRNLWGGATVSGGFVSRVSTLKQQPGIQ